MGGRRKAKSERGESAAASTETGEGAETAADQSVSDREETSNVNQLWEWYRMTLRRENETDGGTGTEPDVEEGPGADPTD